MTMRRRNTERAYKMWRSKWLRMWRAIGNVIAVEQGQPLIGDIVRH